MAQFSAWVERNPLPTVAVLLVFFKAAQLAVDSTALFYYDSGSFLLNALGIQFNSDRSYIYGGLIRVFAVPFHSLPAIVAMQVVMGGLTAWLMALILVRFLRVHPWIAILTVIVFAFDPVQIVHEHMIMTETTALLAGTIYLLTALRYLEQPSPWLLVVLGFAGAVLVGLRITYLPVIVAMAVLLPCGLLFGPKPVPLASRMRPFILALALSIAWTFVFQSGYRHLTGMLAGRDPAYIYKSGSFLLAAVTPLIQPRDIPDPRVAKAVAEQNRTPLPLADPSLRSRQLWDSDGLISRLRSAFHGDLFAEDKAAFDTAKRAIKRDPVRFLCLGLGNYAGYWATLRDLRSRLAIENGSFRGEVNEFDTNVVRSFFGADVSRQFLLQTPSRRYHIFGRQWNVFLLLSPLLLSLAVWMKRENRKALALLLLWSLLLLAATCLGAVESIDRYLHPFSLTGLIGAATLLDIAFRRSRTPTGECPHSQSPTSKPGVVNSPCGRALDITDANYREVWEGAFPL